MLPYWLEKRIETHDQTNNENYELELIKHTDCLGGVGGKNDIYCLNS